MRFVILCRLKTGGDEARKNLRLAHLEYLERNREKIVFGGPALNSENQPEMMIIVTELPERTAAEKFIANEPYTASGAVFETVEIRGWSQVLPEPGENALAAEIEREKAIRSAA